MTESPSSSSTTPVIASSRRAPRPPGTIVALLAALALATLLCVYYDWWPSAGNLTDAGKLIMAVPALIVLAAVVIAWLVRTISFIRRERSITWPMAVVPALVLVAVLVGIVIRPATFDSERPQFERIAQQAIDQPGERTGARNISGIDISSVELGPDGCVYFTSADSSFGTTRGWVYAQGRTPSTRKFNTLKDLGGGWYEFKYGT